jgi:hypothetical protein
MGRRRYVVARAPLSIRSLPDLLAAPERARAIRSMLQSLLE